MSKRYDEAIAVTADTSETNGRAALPLSFSWRGRRYDIDQHLSSWREGGEWWQAPRGSKARSNGRSSNGSRRAPQERDCFRVLARLSDAFATGELDSDGFMAPAPSAVFDLVFDRSDQIWRLARIWD